MPRSNAATVAFRGSQADLTTLAHRDLVEFWRGLDKSDALAVRRALEAFLPDLVQTYGEIGASLAADFYEELRDSSEVSKIYRAVMPEEVVRIEQVRASGRWAIGPLFGVGKDPGPDQALANLVGVTRRLVLAPARNTIRQNTALDPEAMGWRRVGDGHSCNFCRMLIGRGEVYSPETARFGAHDDCGCLAEPAWGGDPIRVEQHIATKRNLTDADRARVRDFMANMPGSVTLRSV